MRVNKIYDKIILFFHDYKHHFIPFFYQIINFLKKNVLFGQTTFTLFILI